MYVVTGATGNTGSVVAKQLLAKGKKVRAIGRNAERLQSLVAQGCRRGRHKQSLCGSGRRVSDGAA